MNKINDVISKNIRKYRKLNHLTQKQLGELVGVSTAAVSNWETGSNSIDIDSLFKVCEALKVSMSEISEETKPFELNSYERELILRYREAKTWEQLSVSETLKVAKLPPHLLHYWEILHKEISNNKKEDKS